jgi:hypothetical protein
MCHPEPPRRVSCRPMCHPEPPRRVSRYPAWREQNADFSLLMLALRSAPRFLWHTVCP